MPSGLSLEEAREILKAYFSSDDIKEYEQAKDNPFLVFADRLLKGGKDFEDAGKRIAEGDKQVAKGEGMADDGERRLDTGELQLSGGRVEVPVQLRRSLSLHTMPICLSIRTKS